MTQTVNTAAVLKQHASSWVDRTFNYISLENAEKVLDNMLFEHIEPNNSEETAKAFLIEHGCYEEAEDAPLEYIEDNYQDEFYEYAEADNYPLWGPLFEFKYNPSAEIIEAAKEAGFGIISGTDHYNTMLFVRGAGYSFYSAHWIPLYLSLPWVDASEFNEVDYSFV